MSNRAKRKARRKQLEAELHAQQEQQTKQTGLSHVADEDLFVVDTGELHVPQSISARTRPPATLPPEHRSVRAAASRCAGRRDWHRAAVPASGRV